jgi:DNA polymerase-3 subunit alpha
MTLLAETTEGMHNLFRLSSRWPASRATSTSPGWTASCSPSTARIIATTGCPSGEVRPLRLGKYDGPQAGDFQDIFGKDNFFLELMDHGLDIEKRVRDGPAPARPRTSASRRSPPTTPTTRPGGRPAHEHLLCVSPAATMADPKPVQAVRLPGRRLLHQVRRRDARAVGRHRPEACDNTLLIAERCDVEFTEGAALHAALPDMPGGRDEESWLRQGGRAGLRARYPDGIPDGGAQAADFELGVITQMGFPGYFLVVADFINWAKDNGIRVGPGRGSAPARSRLRPADHRPRPARARPALRAVPQPRARLDARLRHRLRRASPRRGDPLRHREVRRGPGLEIVTYGTIKAKQAIKDSARILGYPFAMGDRITKAMPPA